MKISSAIISDGLSNTSTREGDVAIRSIHHRAPLVLGDNTLHWLCESCSPDLLETGMMDDKSSFYIVSFDVDAAQAVALPVPPDCVHEDAQPEEMLLACSPEDGYLCLLVARGLEVRVWTLRAGSGKAKLAHRVEVHAETG